MDIKHVKKEIMNAISRSVRIDRPGNYLLKIDSFSLLLQILAKTKRDNYDSCHFEAQGYKWKLSLYPNGDKRRDSDGYVSLYLSLADPKSLSPGEVIHVFIKFFVFDHCRDNYLVLQDGKARRFHALRAEWGFSRLLSLEEFNDPCNGYLIDDSCAFGVEMCFHKNDWKTGSMSMVAAPTSNTYTWKIEKFSGSVSHSSNAYSSAGCQWKLCFERGEASSVKGKSLSLSIHLHDLTHVASGKSIYAELKLIIKDQVNAKHQERTVSYWFSATSTSLCYSDFVLMSDLNDGSSGFVVNDTVVIEVEIMVMSSIGCK